MFGIEINPITGYTSLERAEAMVISLWEFTDPAESEVLTDTTQELFDIVQNPITGLWVILVPSWDYIIKVHSKVNPNSFYKLFPELNDIDRISYISLVRSRYEIPFHRVWPVPYTYRDEDYMDENNFFGSGFTYKSITIFQESVDSIGSIALVVSGYTLITEVTDSYGEIGIKLPWVLYNGYWDPAGIWTPDGIWKTV